MQTLEAASTEKRLDDLNARMAEGLQSVDRQINRLDGDIRELRGEIKVLRGETSDAFATQKRETGERFSTVDAHLISIIARFDAMHRTMMRGFFALGGITVTLFLALAGLQGF
ncbi:MAG TPA: hypothetical protein VFJ53_06165 [Solirubrobacterales bacterium]|nr:hypothetical protein [Solirubrobacterales bacterium]